MVEEVEGPKEGERVDSGKSAAFFGKDIAAWVRNYFHSHDLSNNAGERPEETPDQQRSKADYNSWKRLIKTPPQSNDYRTIERLWIGALTILNGDDRDSKQMPPRDLDDEEYHGWAHIHVLLGMRPHGNGHSTLVTLTRPFLLVITHQALLDC